MRFYCEDKTLDIGVGDVVFLPQSKAHAFTCTSNVVRPLIFVQATGEDPVALDRYFLAMGEPAKSMVLPESAVTYAVDNPEHARSMNTFHLSLGNHNPGEAMMPSRFSTEITRKPEQTSRRPDRPQVDSFEEAIVMTSPATAIKNEIQKLIDLQIQVFGHRAPLTVLELEDCRRRAVTIKSLGRKLDQLGIAAIKQEG